MSRFDEIIDRLKSAEPQDKQQLLTYLHRVVKGNLAKLDPADRQALTDYAHYEADSLLKSIPRTESYRQKDCLFVCVDELMGMIMTLHPSASELSEELRVKIGLLAQLIQQERYIENALDEAFSAKRVEETQVKHLLFLVSQAEDEYQRGQLFSGLAHYRKALTGLSAEIKGMLCRHTCAELKRWLAMEQPGEDCVNALEVAVDVSKFFAGEDLIPLLYEVLKLGYANVSYFTADTLLALEQSVPRETVLSLAQDLGYADLTYHAFLQHGKADQFPAEYASEEYLAKSNLVHWLLYPTELGKYPDAIEYIGKVSYLFKKEVYHVFKYRSDSDQLGDDRRNQWLIGWANDDGGTFSNFDLYADYEKPTVSATLKNIKKKLIG